MGAEVEIELSDGKKLYFGGSSPARGLREVSVSGVVAKASKQRFEAALGSLADLVDILDASLNKVAKRPDTVEMEFGASLTGDCDLWIVSGEAKAEFKVKLVWGGK